MHWQPHGDRSRSESTHHATVRSFSLEHKTLDAPVSQKDSEVVCTSLAERCRVAWSSGGGVSGTRVVDGLETGSLQTGTHLRRTSQQNVHVNRSTSREVEVDTCGGKCIFACADGFVRHALGRDENGEGTLTLEDAVNLAIQGGRLALGALFVSQNSEWDPVLAPLFGRNGPLWEGRGIEFSKLSWFKPPFLEFQKNIKVRTVEKINHALGRPTMHVV